MLLSEILRNSKLDYTSTNEIDYTKKRSRPLAEPLYCIQTVTGAFAFRANKQRPIPTGPPAGPGLPGQCSGPGIPGVPGRK